VAKIPPIEPADTTQDIDTDEIRVIILEISNAIKTNVGAIHGPIGVANDT
jgi:hypothetical protein